MKPIHITFGIIGMLGTMAMANIVVYEMFVRLFPNFLSGKLIVFILVILSLSFLTAIVFGMKHYSTFSRTLFIFTSAWFGYFVYLFFAAFIYLITISIPGIDHSTIGGILVLASILFGIYGLINAQNISIKNLKIKLPNLPKEWNGRRAVFVSDVHVGLVYGRRHVRKIVEKIKKLNPDIVFIGGDLFDGISTPAVMNLIDPFREISAPLGTYFVSGNHEHYGNTYELVKKIESLGIKVLMNEVKIIDGIQLIGIGYSHTTRREGFRKFLESFALDRNMTSILLKHDPKDLKISEDAGINFQISGHTHNAQQWPLNYYARLIYKKFTYGLKHHGKMQIYTSSGVGTWGPPIRVGSKNEIVQFIFKN